MTSCLMMQDELYVDYISGYKLRKNIHINLINTLMLCKDAYYSLVLYKLNVDIIFLKTFFKNLLFHMEIAINNQKSSESDYIKFIMNSSYQQNIVAILI